MRKKIRAVALSVLVAFGVALVGVASVGSGLPVPRGRDAYRAPWRDGAKFLRVQHLGQHFAIVTISEARIVSAMRVTERGRGGAWVADRKVLLMADEAGIAQLGDERPSREWWDRVLGIERGAPREPILAPQLPTAEVRGGY